MLLAFGRWSKVLLKDSWIGPYRQRCDVTEGSPCSKHCGCTQTHKSLTSEGRSTTTDVMALLNLSLLWTAVYVRTNVGNDMLSLAALASVRVAEGGANQAGI